MSYRKRVSRTRSNSAAHTRPENPPTRCADLRSCLTTVLPSPGAIIEDSRSLPDGCDLALTAYLERPLLVRLLGTAEDERCTATKIATFHLQRPRMICNVIEGGLQRPGVIVFAVAYGPPPFRRHWAIESPFPARSVFSDKHDASIVFGCRIGVVTDDIPMPPVIASVVADRTCNIST